MHETVDWRLKNWKGCFPHLDGPIKSDALALVQHTIFCLATFSKVLLHLDGYTKRSYISNVFFNRCDL